MAERSVSFHGLAGWQESETLSTVRQSEKNRTDAMVSCVFDTRQCGYYEIAFGESKLRQYKEEPDINIFPKEDQEYIEVVCIIVWMITFTRHRENG